MDIHLKKTLLLTGGSGFIGRNIKEQLEERYVLLAPGHKDLDLLDDMSVRRFLEAHPIDIVIHAANTDTSVRANHVIDKAEKDIRMFFNLANCKALYKRMVYLGSGAEYDKRKDLVMVTEDKAGGTIPADTYGLAKFVCGQFIEQSEGVVNLRCFGVYGKYEDFTRRFISMAILNALENKPITIRQNVEFDYIYVHDLIRIIEYFVINEPRYKTYNAVRGEKIDLITLAGMVEKVSGKNHGIIVEQGGMNKEYTASNKRLMQELGNFNFTPHEVAIRELYEWYQGLRVDNKN